MKNIYIGFMGLIKSFKARAGRESAGIALCVLGVSTLALLLTMLTPRLGFGASALITGGAFFVMAVLGAAVISRN